MPVSSSSVNFLYVWRSPKRLEIRLSTGFEQDNFWLDHKLSLIESPPDARTLKTLKQRYANEIIEIFGIHVDALTANEAQYLVGFRTADEIRNRLLKAKQEVDL